MQVSSSELVYFNWAKGCSKLGIAQASQMHSPSKPNAHNQGINEDRFLTFKN